MKYEKGTFIVIPNKEHLRGKPSELQAIYLWLCEHSDDTGKSFPTKNTLAEEAGCSHNTLDKYLDMLVKCGMIDIIRRKKEGTNENTSNLYQVNLVPKIRRPSTKINTTGGTNNGLETNLSINKPNLTNIQPKVVPPFSFKEEMDKLINSTWKPNKIIYLYFLKKKFNFQNEKQFKSEYGRCLKPAKELEGYNSAQIEATMNKMDELGLTWTLNAIGRNISNVINSNK